MANSIPSVPSVRLAGALSVAALSLLAGCKTGPYADSYPSRPYAPFTCDDHAARKTCCDAINWDGGGGGAVAAVAPVGEMSLDRGAWLLGRETGIWAAQVPSDNPKSPPVRLGYVVANAHRQVRGGPEFTVYEVMDPSREHTLGIVDSLGNAKRFVPKRNGMNEVEDKGNSTLPLSVGAIFETTKPVTLVPTSRKKIAFEMLDLDHNGYLDKNELPRIGAARGNPDLNHDGKVDLGEYEAADDL